MTTDLEMQVHELLARELGVNRAHLTPATRLAHDLGCDGDDARELLEQFARQFSVTSPGSN